MPGGSASVRSRWPGSSRPWGMDARSCFQRVVPSLEAGLDILQNLDPYPDIRTRTRDIVARLPNRSEWWKDHLDYVIRTRTTSSTG